MTFDTVNFLFGNGDVCHATSHGIYISQLIPFARASSPKRVRENSRECHNHKLITFITKTYLYSLNPLKPHFYIVKLGFTGVCIIFLISAQKHRLWVLVRTASARRF